MEVASFVRQSGRGRGRSGGVSVWRMWSESIGSPSKKRRAADGGRTSRRCNASGSSVGRNALHSKIVLAVSPPVWSQGPCQALPDL